MTVKPKPKADVRDVFRTQLEKLAENAKNAHQALLLQEQRKWCKPDLQGWSGDPFDLDGMSEAFKRDANHEDFLNALKSDDPGAIGDLAVSQLQGDWLAALERAYRRRYASSVRSRMHAAGRLFGHGHDMGPFKQGVMKWLEGMVQSTKGGK